jgi:hypothetical protein
MDEATFRATLTQAAPPADWSAARRALWWDARGDWDRAHGAAMEAGGGRDADHVHAYLHRKEGDAGNAAYWYRRAGVPVFRGSPEEEHAALVHAL